MSGESCDENELHGPKVGVKLTLDQADLLIQRHFSDLKVVNISHINRGYNNRVYIVTVIPKDASCTNTDQLTYILRVSGRFWTRYKTENEVGCLLYMRKYGKIPVPRVFGYCTDKMKSGVNGEYIIMEKMRGQPLEHFWKQLNLPEKKQILDQVAEILGKMQKTKFSEIGSFQFEPDVGNSLGLGIDPETDLVELKDFVRVGKGVEFDGGPCNTYLDYFKCSVETEIRHLKDCAFMRDAQGYERRLGRIEKFIKAFASPETIPENFNKEALENVPFVFTHGDLEPRNILANRKTLQITSVIDFEFSGSYPIDDEWFTSFGFVRIDTSESKVFNELLKSPEQQQDHIENSKQEDENMLREHFLQELRKNGVAVPDDIPGHMIRAELYYFKGYICPWWLREKRDPIPESHYGDREKASLIVDAVLDKYGF